MSNHVRKPKSIIALMTVVVMILTMVIPMSVFAQAKFSDIADNWASKEITYWVDQGLVKGYPDGTFKPDNSIIRAEFIALVNRLFKYSATAPVTFDATENDWFYSDIAKAEKAGYLSAFKPESFKLRENITRQEVAAIIVKIKGLQESPADAGKFSDAAAMTAAYKGFIGAVAKAGMMNGYNDGKFGGADKLTRAQAVVILDRLNQVSIKAIIDNTVSVGSSINIIPTITPADAKISAKSSDDTIATATVNGEKIEIKGIKEGNVTITVTAAKVGMRDGTTSFKITVAKAVAVSSGSSSSSSSSNGNTTPPPPPPPPPTTEKANITVDVTAIPSIVYITVNSATVGSKFKVQGTNPEDFGKPIEVYVTSGDTKVVSILDATGRVIGTITVNVKADSTKDYTFRKIVANDAIANITVDVTAIPSIVYITVNNSTVGSKFKVEGTNTEDIGKPIEVYITTGDTKVVSILDAAGNVIGNISVNIKADSTKDYSFVPVELSDATANITVDVTAIPSIVYITVNKSSVGSKFKVEGTESEDIGKPLEVYVTTGDTKVVSILNATGNVLGNINVNVKSDSTKDYTFKVAGSVNNKPTINVVEPDGVSDGIITLVQGHEFSEPTVTASDPEDGNITGSIVKTGSVNAAVIGEYTLTYNVSDSKGLAADQRTVLVKVIVLPSPGEKKANIKVDVIESLPVFVYITVNSTTTEGTQFQVQNSNKIVPIGQTIKTMIASGDTLTVNILNASGNVVGTATVNKQSDNTQDYPLN